MNILGVYQTDIAFAFGKINRDWMVDMTDMIPYEPTILYGPTGHPVRRDGFSAILEELRDLHDKKSADYGTDEDSLANIRQTESYGIPAWVGAIIRGGDKVKRIQTFVKKGKLMNESVEDSLRDLAVYAVIALQLYREAEKGGEKCKSS